jgi:hypothetical protein
MKKNKILKIFGIVFIVIGTLFITISPYTLYFYYLPLIILILGVFLVWFSNFKLTYKLIWTITPICFYATFTYFSTVYNTLTPEIFLIPNHYRGKINILYKENCGEFLKEINNILIYKIPNDGILYNTDYSIPPISVKVSHFVLVSKKATMVFTLP